MKLRRRAGIALLGAGLVLLSCGADQKSAPVESRAAAATRVRAVLPTDAPRGVTRPARVVLPVRASDEVTLEDDTSHISVRFALEHVQDARIEVADGLALYRGALDGADVVHHVHAEGTEDFVSFETRPAREELSYSVDVSRVPGLRLVSNTLEFLDESGSPRLRVAPPYVVDAVGARHEAKLAVAGCAVDADPAGPWGRAVTKPGSPSCVVRVTWAGGLAYPAIVDPAWTATGSMATARASHVASLLVSGKVLLVGGCNGGPCTPIASAELYDPATGTFAATGVMGTTRQSPTASVLGSGKVLVAGGYSGPAPVSSAELYDPVTGIFTATTGPMTGPHGIHTATTLASGKVLLAGGVGAVSYVASAELYDSTSDTFTATGSMTVERGFHTASFLGTGKVLVAGTNANGGASAELFDPALGTFTATASMTTARAAHTASVLASGEVLVAGGTSSFGNSFNASAELYDSANGSFASTGSMAGARVYHTASVLPSGKVLVAGGQTTGNATLKSAELYDPATGVFTGAGSMKAPRSAHTATILPSGKVLVAGGNTTGGGTLSSAELFEIVPAGGTCSVGNECVSGVCEDGVCCSGACGGSCKTCAPGTGACVAVTGADDPDTCTGDNSCDAAGACKLKTGQACPGGSATCASGSCADGYCCGTPCDAACDRCNVQPGTCTLAPRGDVGAASCFPFVCDGKEATCPTSCTGDSDCAAGGHCDTSTHVCIGFGGTCDGDHTTTDATGKTQDCAPYKCNPTGGCKQPCGSVDDCVAPSACAPDGHCVQPASGQSGGCSGAPVSAPGAPPFAFLAVVAVFAGVRRARRRRAGPSRERLCRRE